MVVWEPTSAASTTAVKEQHPAAPPPMTTTTAALTTTTTTTTSATSLRWNDSNEPSRSSVEVHDIETGTRSSSGDDKRNRFHHYQTTKTKDQSTVEIPEANHDDDDDNSNSDDDSQAQAAAVPNRRFSPDRILSSIIGTLWTLQEGQKEIRQKPMNMTYEPTHRWWQPPLSAWFPENNREILFLLVAYYVLIVVLARYTALCGRPSSLSSTTTSSQGVDQFCADDWILLEDQALTGTAVGMFLLLAFRANQAYDRFWEGRRMWGRMKEVCRDYARLVCILVQVRTVDEQEDRRRAVAFLTAFAVTTKLHLRQERDVYRDFQKLGLSSLSLQDIANIQNAPHMPLFCLDILTHYVASQVRSGKLSDYQLATINTTVLAVLSDTLGSCERLRNTPIPLSYVLQLRFFLLLWLLLYPLHVVAYYGWWTLLLASLIAYAVLGIDSMACEIENPFGYDRNDLDLDKMVQGFFQDTQAILQRADDQFSNYVFHRKSVNSLSSKLSLGLLGETVDFSEHNNTIEGTPAGSERENNTPTKRPGL